MSDAATAGLLADFDRFIQRIETSSDVAAAVARCALPEGESARLLSTYTLEARAGLQLVAPLLRDGMRILEVGSGICVLTRFLTDQGYDITGIEPAASGFGYMHEIGGAILALEGPARTPQWLPIGAEALDPARHGTFDLIFSTNVVEHIDDLDGAFRGMAAVLKPDGRMVHHCPNYFLPYEPHFGIPLIPVFPGLTRFLFPKTLTRYPGLWRELNFITAGRVKRLSRRFGLQASFDRGVLGKILRRFEEDDVFRDRQGGLAGLVSKVIGAFGLMDLADKVPGEFLSPMVMRITHADKAGARS